MWHSEIPMRLICGQLASRFVVNGCGHIHSAMIGDLSAQHTVSSLLKVSPIQSERNSWNCCNRNWAQRFRGIWSTEVKLYGGETAHYLPKMHMQMNVCWVIGKDSKQQITLRAKKEKLSWAMIAQVLKNTKITTLTLQHFQVI